MHTRAVSTPEEFQALIKNVARHLAGQPLDAALATFLNTTIPPQSELFVQISAACNAAIAGGWMCAREAAGIRYGRVIKPTAELYGFSVDVVDMDQVKGPHHSHPQGEIDMIMPLSPGARFDGHGAGWVVYGPGSAHFPTVTAGRALILYLLPQGAIEFTR
ncbi:MAG: DUF4863 family protein [Pseudomonadota bacterium]|nr:DUF4863 family protein [Pseudomonadota bacterium]